ncbi:Retrovirus-related Pol polyprotein from transposon TNT 1-94 [Senna tora]|uniref:Retrovirus-related Pol polyprotein from transposon TNT 1-94 n=1 Tax=Senna tora TaxID=362788 RepID=A0A834X0X6_9FABA|nr:Retrovirus-related Pol polyprotein from transposon TNT 1-94 [Senna tora]
MEEEVTALKKIKIWELEPKPIGVQPILCKWV